MGAKKEFSLKTKALIKGLGSEDENTLIKTLTKIEKNGNENLIIPMIELGLRSKNESIHDHIQRILFNLKISSSHPILLDQIKTMPENPFRKIALAAVWNANINGLSHLDSFVKIAVEGDYFEALECLTVIEESEGELIEEKILDSLLILKDYMNIESNKKDPKYPIIENIHERVETLNRGHL